MRTKKEDELIVLGKKGARFLEEAGENFVYFEGIGHEVEYTRAVKIADFLIGQYLKRKWGLISFVYPHFISIALQKIKVLKFLPYEQPAAIIEKDTPDEDAGIPQQSRAVWTEEIIAEPSWERVVDYLVRSWANSMVCEIFWESKLSEWAARIIHLEGSNQTLSDWYKNLRLRYLKCMHELRDINIREIFASRLE